MEQWTVEVDGVVATVTRRAGDPQTYDFKCKIGDTQRGFFATSRGSHEMTPDAMKDQLAVFLAQQD